MACIVPALWYVAAYKQGGDAFLALVIEENFGRMMGKMSYDSHITSNSTIQTYTSLLAWLVSLHSFSFNRFVLRSMERWNETIKVCFKGAKELKR